MHIISPQIFFAGVYYMGRFYVRSKVAPKVLPDFIGVFLLHGEILSKNFDLT